MTRMLIAILCLMLTPVAAHAQGKLVPFPQPSPTLQCAQVPQWWLDANWNPDGSCVLLSSSVGGVQSNDPKCTTLPFDSAYGPAERGGANPERIAHICAKRGIHAYNVTGQPSIPMARWAVATGRGCAIGFDYEHFQALWGYDYSRKVWYVWDNRYPKQLREYTEAEFERMHDRSGRWVIVMERPGDRIPKPREW